MWDNRSAGLCPKCGSLSWFEKNGDDVIHRCLCGFHKVVYTKQGCITMIHRPKSKHVMLPRAGTKISKCLSALAKYHPRELSTAEVAVIINFKRDEVASHLMLLMQRGLIERVVNKRGKSGGSHWELSVRAQKLLSLG